MSRVTGKADINGIAKAQARSGDVSLIYSVSTSCCWSCFPNCSRRHPRWRQSLASTRGRAVDPLLAVAALLFRSSTTPSRCSTASASDTSVAATSGWAAAKISDSHSERVLGGGTTVEADASCGCCSVCFVAACIALLASGRWWSAVARNGGWRKRQWSQRRRRTLLTQPEKPTRRSSRGEGPQVANSKASSMLADVFVRRVQWSRTNSQHTPQKLTAGQRIRRAPPLCSETYGSRQIPPESYPLPSMPSLSTRTAVLDDAVAFLGSRMNDYLLYFLYRSNKT